MVWNRQRRYTAGFSCLQLTGVFEPVELQQKRMEINKDISMLIDELNQMKVQIKSQIHLLKENMQIQKKKETLINKASRQHNALQEAGNCVIFCIWETREPRRLALHIRRGYPPDGRKEGLPVITYEEFFLFCTFIMALVGLCYQIFKDRK